MPEGYPGPVGTVLAPLTSGSAPGAGAHADDRHRVRHQVVDQFGGAAFFAAHGSTRIHRVLTDNAKNYRISHAFQQACADLGACQKFTRPHRPWTNGKAERLNRTLLNPRRPATLQPTDTKSMTKYT